MGDVRQVGIPGKEVRPGVYTGLNVAANWDKINVTGPVYVGGMTKIEDGACLLYTSPSPRDYAASRMPSSA